MTGPAVSGALVRLARSLDGVGGGSDAAGDGPATEAVPGWAAMMAAVAASLPPAEPRAAD